MLVFALCLVQSCRQIERRLIIFFGVYVRVRQPFYFWEYTYSGPSNFGRFGQIFWRYSRTPVNRSLASGRFASGPLPGALPLNLTAWAPSPFDMYSVYPLPSIPLVQSGPAPNRTHWIVYRIPEFSCFDGKVYLC